MTLLVSGANGFVGAYLMKELKIRGFYAVGVDRESHLPSIMKNNSGIEVFIHLAGKAHNLGKQIYADYERDNLIYTRELFQHFKQSASAKRFIFLSTAKVLGEGSAFDDQFLFDEDSEVAPADFYALSKRQAEEFLLKEAESLSDEKEVIILRPPLIYGPGVKANFKSLLKLSSFPIPLPLANIKNKRSFLFLGNLADALIKCAKSPFLHGGSKVYHLTDGSDFSLPELMRLMAHAQGKASLLFPFPYINDCCRYFYRLSLLRKKIEKLFGSFVLNGKRFQHDFMWTPPYDTQVAMKMTVDRN